jgi:signal transduction histidine kinase
MNLIRNSVQAVDSGVKVGAVAGEGMVRIRAWREGSVTLIEVRDNGPGVPEKVRGHLFEPFRASGRAGGTGLGLAISAELTRAHGGVLKLVAEEGSEGAVFVVVIPDRVSELRPGRRSTRHEADSFPGASP